MTDTEKLNALADDIAAGFEREPWRDQPGMGYVEIQMDRADQTEYRAMAARIAKLEAKAAAPAKNTFLASKAVPSPQEIKASAHISALMAGWDEAANENAELRRQIAQLEAERDALADVIRALRRGDCWCEVAIGNPMMGGRHSAACVKASAAIAALESDGKPTLADATNTASASLADLTATYNDQAARLRDCAEKLKRADARLEAERG